MRRAAFVAFLALATVMLATTGPDEPESVEALTQVRAKIAWSSPIQLFPSGLAGRGQFIEALPTATQQAVRDGPIVLLRDNTFSRQSNPDPAKTPVVAGTAFLDQLRFTPSIDVANALLHVHQPGLGPDKDQCHVTITSIVDSAGTRVGPVLTAAGSTEIALGTLRAASAPYEITIKSQIPTGSQSVAPTPRLLSSVIRIGQQVPERVTPGAGTPTPVRRYRACGGEIGGRGFFSLNRALVIRTELNRSSWAIANGKATPTVIGQ